MIDRTARAERVAAAQTWFQDSGGSGGSGSRRFDLFRVYLCSEPEPFHLLELGLFPFFLYGLINVETDNPVQSGRADKKRTFTVQLTGQWLSMASWWQFRLKQCAFTWRVDKRRRSANFPAHRRHRRKLAFHLPPLSAADKRPNNRLLSNKRWNCLLTWRSFLICSAVRSELTFTWRQAALVSTDDLSCLLVEKRDLRADGSNV